MSGVEMADLSQPDDNDKEDAKRSRIEEESAKVLQQYLLSPKDVVMNKRIGAGSFGEVCSFIYVLSRVACSILTTVVTLVRCFKAPTTGSQSPSRQ